MGAHRLFLTVRATSALVIMAFDEGRSATVFIVLHRARLVCFAQMRYGQGGCLLRNYDLSQYDYLHTTSIYLTFVCYGRQKKESGIIEA